MSNIIIQCAAGPDHIRLLELTREHHQRLYPWADIRHFNRGLYPQLTGRTPHWDKIFYLNEVMKTAADGDVAAYLDCDVIGRAPLPFEFDVLMGAFDFAAVRNRWGIFNSGVMFWRVNDQTRKVVARIHAQGPEFDHPTREEFVLAQHITSLKCLNLPSNYNLYGNIGESPNGQMPTFFQAFHGLGPEHAAREIRRILNEIASQSL